jgi:hypothetical protein
MAPITGLRRAFRSCYLAVRLQLSWLTSCVLLGLACGLAPRTTHAVEPLGALELTWQAPAECPDQPRLLAQIAALLPPRGEPPKRLQANATAEHVGDDRWILRLRLVSETGVEQREVVGDSCRALVDALAVMLALQLGPTAEEPERVVKPEPPVTALAPPPPPPPRKVAPRSRWQLGISGVGDSAALPRFALGARADVGWSHERWYLGLGASAWLPQEQALATGHTGSGRFRWLAATAMGCHASWGSALRLGPCVALEMGELSAKSSKVKAPAHASELWLAALGGVGFGVPLGSTWLFTSNLSVVVPLTRPRFVIEGIGDVHQPRPIGARSSLGLAARF